MIKKILIICAINATVSALTMECPDCNYDTLVNGIKNVALNLKMNYELRGANSILIKETIENYAILNINKSGLGLSLEISATTVIHNFMNRKEIREIDNDLLPRVLFQAIDQEIKGNESKYFSIVNNYGNRTFAYLLTFAQPSIGAFYNFNQGVFGSSPNLKWWVSIGNLILIEAPSISLLFSNEKKYRSIGIFGCIANRLFIGSILVHFTFAENDRFKKSGYKFKFGK
jgi:hypothetical protein